MIGQEVKISKEKIEEIEKQNIPSTSEVEQSKQTNLTLEENMTKFKNNNKTSKSLREIFNEKEKK